MISVRIWFSEFRIPNSDFLLGYTLAVPETTPELDYYRAVEDLFASLRGVAHVLSPKDFQLLRSWWRDQVPMTAIAAGVTEVFARRSERGESDPVTSLGYCRHAVARHAKRLAEMRVGAETGPEEETVPVAEVTAGLAARMRAAAGSARDAMPAVAEVCDGVAAQVEASADMPLAVFEEHLFALETLLLAGCWKALSEGARCEIERESADQAAASGASGKALERTRVALRDRELRRRLGLPRLELP